MRSAKRAVSYLIALTLILAANVCAYANEDINGIYVDTMQGNDNNSGEKHEPLKSIECAIEKAQKQNVKQKIVLEGGTYFIDDLSKISGTGSTYISYVAEEGTNPVIKQQAYEKVQIKNVEFSGITFEGPCGVGLINSENVTFTKCSFNNTETVSLEISEGCKNITVTDSCFYNTSGSALLINDGKKPQNAPFNCIIKNNEFLNCLVKSDSGSVIIIESGNSCKFLSNTISDFSGYAIVCGQSHNTSQTYKTLSDIEISNNFIYTKKASYAPIKIFGVNGAETLNPNYLSENYIMTDYSPDIWGIELISSAEDWYVMQNVIQGFGNAVKLHSVKKGSISVNDNYCDIYKSEPLITDVENSINYRCFNGMRTKAAQIKSTEIISRSGAKNENSDYLMRIMPEKRCYELNLMENPQLNVTAYDANGNIIKDELTVSYEVIGNDGDITVSDTGKLTVNTIPLGNVRVSVTYKGKTLETVIKIEEKFKNDVTSLLYTTAGTIRPFKYYSKFYSANVHNYMEFSKNGTAVYTVNVPDSMQYRLYMSALRDLNMGMFRIYVDGKLLNSEFDFYGNEEMCVFDLGEIKSTEKTIAVKIECIGRNPLSAGTAFLLKGFHLGK